MRRVLSLLLVAAVLGGCSGQPESAPEPASSAGPVKVMSHSDAQALAAKYRDEAVSTIGGSMKDAPTENLVTCEGPHTFAALTYGDVPVAADQQPAVLQKLRDHYVTEKYSVEPPSTDPSDHGALNATGPDRVTLSVVGDGTEFVRINVATPCFQSTEPL
ncbi:hypothetical protein [Dactylosporangium sp. CA-139066]|uniref:hypothetical protein n=1 Tax=Dactylosporangium sp. CA-139066 TaxID=3239930 RepID=UPI003D9480AD